MDLIMTNSPINVLEVIAEAIKSAFDAIVDAAESLLDTLLD